jgi:hypothetical protein
VTTRRRSRSQLGTLDPAFKNGLIHQTANATSGDSQVNVKSFFEENEAYLEKIATIKAPDEAMQITTDHMKSAYETSVAGATRIGYVYKDFF